jgi:hypothetical protein
MSVEPVKAYVKPHGLVYRDADFIDLDFDEIATEDPEYRDRRLGEPPSRYLLRTSHRRGAQTRSVTPAAPPAGIDHDQPSGDEPSPRSPLGLVDDGRATA